ncbi:hydroxymethylpyrimidine synthase [Methanothermus fervidus DSM 2088]|uniref:Phosphomethylpyrimidine synthase n=1 Tax=Methanothermus fervidus (strain ATCC 43054 / DSM 2088 / JCM 10308 / V24 S) TaxID=523846 RepID=E3GYC2_METFV|nr:phosphomethylpyrimidine synthase [Methanothermus fervidus]ADP77304.1 hydroxymethylpyrimidine synthase [Methanothermus fervidus DSM 2088]
MTLMEEAAKGNITNIMVKSAKMENIEVEKIVRGLARGEIVIPHNVNRSATPCAIGKHASTKVNANVGSSPDHDDVDLEVKKAKIAVKYGSDTVMDLSTGKSLSKIRKAILKNVDVPVGTVPIYEAGVKARKKKGAVIHMDEDDMLKAIETQAKDGVDFMTIHCGVTKDIVDKLSKSERIMGIVSRGGAFIAAWIKYNEKENPLYQNFEYILDIAYEYDVTLSLGDGLRPGCLYDASDMLQIRELINLGELVAKAREKNVQCMVEGPGHMPLDQIAANVKIQKSICKNAPFYVLGPIVTDISPGYDHITAAIGGAIAAAAGADFLCYVTPTEHLSIPGIKEVKEGVIAAKIAAQAADVSKGLSKAWSKELKMSEARKDFKWDEQFKLALDPKKAKKYYEPSKGACSMCGEYCAIKILKDLFE